MKIKRAPIAAASILILFAAVVPSAFSQLPPTNMGKWVHTPGDNQYDKQAQGERHTVPQQMMAPVQNGGGGGGGAMAWVPTPAPHRPDISLEPIAADEPVAPSGFPPMPDRLDLPVQMGWAQMGGGNMAGGHYSGGGGGGAPQGGPPQPTGSHQHYNHYEPGSFGQSASHGYYKASTPPPPNSGVGDVYSSSGHGGGGGGGGVAGGIDYGARLRGLGREPSLNKNDPSSTPDAPQPVTINQASTQDLSLPEDEFAYQRPPNTNGTGTRVKKRIIRALLRPVNSVGSYAGINF